MISKNLVVGTVLSTLVLVNNAFAAKGAVALKSAPAPVVETVSKLTAAETKTVILSALANPTKAVDAKTLQALGVSSAQFMAGVNGLLSGLGVSSSAQLDGAKFAALESQVERLVATYNSNITTLFSQLPGINAEVLAGTKAVQGVASTNMSTAATNAAPIARVNGGSIVEAIAFLESNAGADVSAQQALAELKAFQASIGSSTSTAQRQAYNVFLPVALMVTPTTVSADKAVRATVDAIVGVHIAVRKAIATEAKAGAFLVSVLNGLLAHESNIGNELLVAGYKNVVQSVGNGVETEATSCVLGNRNEFSKAQSDSFCAQYGLCF